MDAVERCPHKAVHRLLGDHEGKVVDLGGAVRLLKLPVVECGDLGYHVSDAGIDELFRRALDNCGICDDAICKTCRNRSSPIVYDQRCAGAGEAVAGRGSRNADKRQFAQETDVLCRVNDLAAAKSDHCLRGIGQAKCQIDDVANIDSIDLTVFQHLDAGVAQGIQNFAAKHVDQTVSEINDDFFEITAPQIDADMFQCIGLHLQYGGDCDVACAEFVHGISPSLNGFTSIIYPKRQGDKWNFSNP